MKTNEIAERDVSVSPLAQNGGEITGVLHCWDRLRFMGSILTLQRPCGMYGFLRRMGVLLKDFAQWSKDLTAMVRAHGLTLAKAAGQQGIEYLRRSTERKEAVVRERLQRGGIKEGLIGVWSAVEPCLSFFLRRDATRRELVLEHGPGKCLHLYFYFMHAVYGLLHVRLQTWFPFSVTVCLNGHEWLARQMDAAGVSYERCENAFRWLEDPQRAQALADAQQKSDWPKLLESLLQECHPLGATLCAPIGQRYYWSLKESEYSSDLLFRSSAELAALYPRLLRYGMEHFGCRDVLRFLGRRVPREGVHGNFEGELNTSLLARCEGVRLKHYADGNTLKMYDKVGTVLRVETTINQPAGFRVWRESKSDAQAAWRPMRRGIADVHRRAEVSRAVNERYLKALAAVESPRRTGEVAAPIFRPVRRQGRRHRALNPWTAADAKLLEAINDAAWLVNGMRNRDLRARLFPGRHTAAQTKVLAAKITRRLVLLRAHGLLRKVPHTHRYQVTDHGREIITALQTARATSIDALLKMAA